MDDAAAADYRGIWVVIEQEDGRIAGSGAKLLGTARTLADGRGAPVTAVLLTGSATGEGGGGSATANEAIAFGADTALLAGDEHLTSFTAPAYAAAVAALAAERHPAVVMLADGPTARDLAPRLARRLGTGLTSAADPGTLDLDPAGGTLLATRREWSGRLFTTYAQPRARPQVVTVRVASAPAPYADDWRYGNTETADLSAVAWPETSGQWSVVSGQGATPQSAIRSPQSVVGALRGARCVVVGGRGVGSAEGFARVQRLAAALDGEWGATEGAVEAGWAPPEREIGLYGTTVRPDLYIGCGISGSPQHVVGMQQARTIVAINTDPNAPIFRWANYAVVADSNQLIDLLLERLIADR